MESATNPVRRAGQRNINCPYYRGCLDHAVDQNWNSWNCSQCRNKTLIDPSYRIEAFTDFSSEYIGVPNSVMRIIEG